jgi:hypothetical protein
MGWVVVRESNPGGDKGPALGYNQSPLQWIPELFPSGEAARTRRLIPTPIKRRG